MVVKIDMQNFVVFAWFVLYSLVDTSDFFPQSYYDCFNVTTAIV